MTSLQNSKNSKSPPTNGSEEMEKSPSPSTTKPNDLSGHAKLMDALSKPTTHHSRMLCVVTTPNVPSVVNMLNAMHRMKLCGMPHFPQVI